MINQLRAHLQMYGATEVSTLELLALTLTRADDPQLLLRLAQLLQGASARRLRQSSVSAFQQAGFTRIQAERLAAICELTRRLALLEIEPSPRIESPDDAVRLLLPLMGHLDQETFRVLVLDTHHQVVENTELYRGTINGAEVRVAEILRPAVLRKCPALLVAHAHPTGDPEPSFSDLAMTEQLVQAARLLDIDLVDHLIIGGSRTISLRSRMQW
jgi:DNA repair protein RadC